MAFYAGRVILHPAMENPTLVVLTDRNDLDDQLFGTFARCRDLLRQPPVQAADRADLRAKLTRGFRRRGVHHDPEVLPRRTKGDRHPVLSERRNIVVIADEAHRSQYDFIDGFARHMRDALPNASFIGFTGTPIEQTDANTRAVFGDYISVYDIQRAVIDGATVPIYYESRLAKLELKEAERPKIDPEFEEATEGEEVERKEKLKSRWAQLEAVVGSENRIKLIARDLVEHFENRLATLDGKAMVVCMSRRICVDLYREIAALRPAWHRDDDEQGAMKVVMTGSASDPLEWQQHIRNKKRREDTGAALPRSEGPVPDRHRARHVADRLRRAEPAHHVRGQADARARADAGHRAGEPRVQGQAGRAGGGLPGPRRRTQEGAGDLHRERRHRQDGARSGRGRGGDAGEVRDLLRPVPRLRLVAVDHRARRRTGCRCCRPRRSTSSPRTTARRGCCARSPTCRRRSRSRCRTRRRCASATTSASSRPCARCWRRARPASSKTDEELDHAIRQIISKAVVSDEVVDIFAAAGLKKPDISILSDEFLAEVRGMPQRNLAVELLQKLLKGEIKTRAKRNVVQARSFAELLEQAIRKYQNRAIETAQVIEELIQLAKDMRAANARGEALGLTEDELAFYDALEVNDSAVKVLGEPTLVDDRPRAGRRRSRRTSPSTGRCARTCARNCV